MKITTVTYKRLVSVEKFGNVSLEATGQLDDGEDRDEAYNELRRWVDLQVNTRKLAIEGKLSQEDDEPVPQVWPQVGAQPAPQPSMVNGQNLRVGSISGQQLISGGQVVAQARVLPFGLTDLKVTAIDPDSKPDQQGPSTLFQMFDQFVKDRSEDEAFAADWAADSADLAGGVMCPDCEGSGSTEDCAEDCARCAGSGSVEPIAMVV